MYLAAGRNILSRWARRQTSELIYIPAWLLLSRWLAHPIAICRFCTLPWLTNHPVPTLRRLPYVWGFPAPPQHRSTIVRNWTPQYALQLSSMKSILDLAIHHMISLGLDNFRSRVFCSSRTSHASCRQQLLVERHFFTQAWGRFQAFILVGSQAFRSVLTCHASVYLNRPIVPINLFRVNKFWLRG